MLVEATIQHSQTSSYKYLKIITGFFFANDYLNKNTSNRPSIKKILICCLMARPIEIGLTNKQNY